MKYIYAKGENILRWESFISSMILSAEGGWNLYHLTWHLIPWLFRMIFLSYADRLIRAPDGTCACDGGINRKRKSH